MAQEIVRGVQDKPGRYVIHGPAGMGKSTLASLFPKPIFHDTEDGTDTMNVDRLKKPSSVSHFLSQVNDLTKDHMGYLTYVLDTADWLQDLFITFALAKTNMKVMGWTKDANAYETLYEDWTRMLEALTALRDSGMIVVLVAHTDSKKREVPEEFGAFDRYQLKLFKGAAAKTIEWAEYALFLNMRVQVVKDGEGKHASLKGTGGERVIYSTQHPCWDAKAKPGSGLPDTMVFRDGKLPDELLTLLKRQVASIHPAGKPAPAPAIETSRPVMHVTPGKEPSKALSALLDLMESSQITGDAVMAVVAKHGYFPKDKPLDELPEDFISGALIANWTMVAAEIKGETANV